jgi:hypothetical protein
VSKTMSDELIPRSALPSAAGASATAVAHTVPQTTSAPVRPSDIVMMDAVSLARAIRSRQVSCLEVMTSYLNHIEQMNPDVNAIVALQGPAHCWPSLGNAIPSWRKDFRGKRIAWAGDLQGCLPQIIGPNRAELSCLQPAYGYDMANGSTKRRPTLLKQLPVQPASSTPGPTNDNLGRGDDSNAVLRNPAGPSSSI